MHELIRQTDRGGDPDKTNPPTRVEELWGCTPGHRHDAMADESGSEVGSHPAAAIALTGNDAMTLYWAARDCLIAGAYSGATSLLRRLIFHLTDERADEAGTREEAERLLTLAEMLLDRPPEPPADRSTDA